MQFFHKFTTITFALFFSGYCFISTTHAYDCQTLLQDNKVTNTDWASLEPCLGVANSKGISANTSQNVWRLIKIAFDGIENIPTEVYGKIRFVLTAITIDELQNISMSRVEMVEAFGGVYALSGGDMNNGFSDAQMKLIASKVRYEWYGKEPETYSEYDLISMANIVCHLNESDIENIHADAFKVAAEFIGSIESCPEMQLHAFAKLAMRKEAFGDAKDWSKIDVSAIGNIINGLSQSELAAIDGSTLQLNHFYVEKQKNVKNKKRSKNNNTTTDGGSNTSANKTSRRD